MTTQHTDITIQLHSRDGFDSHALPPFNSQFSIMIKRPHISNNANGVLHWRKINMIKRIIIIGIFLLIMISPPVAFAIMQGDIDNSGNIDLKDAIISLQISAGMHLTDQVYTAAGIIGNGKIGIGDVIYVLQKLSGLRPTPFVAIWDSSLWDNILWAQ
jgi:hypothetical protein